MLAVNDHDSLNFPSKNIIEGIITPNSKIVIFGRNDRMISLYDNSIR